MAESIEERRAKEALRQRLRRARLAGSLPPIPDEEKSERTLANERRWAVRKLQESRDDAITLLGEILSSTENKTAVQVSLICIRQSIQHAISALEKTK